LANVLAAVYALSQNNGDAWGGPSLSFDFSTLDQLWKSNSLMPFSTSKNKIHGLANLQLYMHLCAKTTVAAT